MVPRRKRQSWLPENVTPYKDRHGKTRYRYRKAGQKPHHFKSEPGTPEFMEELRQAQTGAPADSSVIPMSMDDLALRLFRSPKWLAMQASSQHTYRRIIERYLERVGKSGQRYGSYPVKRVTVSGLEAHIAELKDTPAAANNLRKALKRMFKYAIKLDWITSNPAAETDGFRAGKGWATWSDVEIERYRDHWANGTMARLTLEIALNTAARRCNLAVLERDHLRDGRWEIDHVKGNDETSVAITAECKAAIDALPAAPIRFFITSELGTPFSIEGLSNRFRKWARDAECPGSLHGLRKGVSRRLGEAGATTLEGRAITGHKNDRTFLHYAEKANRRTLADAAQAKLIGEPHLANPEKSE